MMEKEIKKGKRRMEKGRVCDVREERNDEWLRKMMGKRSVTLLSY